MGVGLHAYGFIDGGWLWFFIFVILQASVIPLAFLKILVEDKKDTAIN